MKIQQFRLKDFAYWFFWIKLLITRKTVGKLNYLYAWYWGVKLGKNCEFSSKTYFYRNRNSTIEIADNCTLFSFIGANLQNRPCSILTLCEGARIEIGNSVGMSGTVIGAHKFIKIGNNVRCGANSFIFDGDFHNDDTRVGDPKDVIIEDNVWLGMNTIVLKGVTIGENSIIGAGSVVTRNIPANVIAAGNPCKVIKQIVYEKNL